MKTAPHLTAKQGFTKKDGEALFLYAIVSFSLNQMLVFLIP